MSTAVVVGSGPNGLVAAVRLAEAGLSVRVLELADRPGGGLRTSELTVPGVLHDDCSAFHPTALASPAFRALGLESDGLRWRWPEVDLVHPQDDGSAGVLWRDLNRTVAGLGPDGPAWRRAHQSIAGGFDDLAEDILRPLVHLPRHPLRLARFGVPSLLPASVTVRQWSTVRARALFGGAAAHAFTSLRAPLSSAVGYTLVASAHRYGWAVAEGGSGAIAAALVHRLERLGGRVETGVRVGALSELDDPDVVLLDTTPTAAAAILGDRLPSGVARTYRRFRYGPAAFKVDLAVHEGIPWTNPWARTAGALHLGGTFAEIADAEDATVRGLMPDRPFVLVGQQYLADPTRSAGEVHPIWAYAHVPQGYSGDATAAVLDQIERFAPGFRERVVATHVRGPAGLEAYNPNYVGGDISAGSNAGLRVVFRPGLTLSPYATGVPGVYLCSSSTPPGGGVHGMSGANAADAALGHLRR